MSSSLRDTKLDGVLTEYFNHLFMTGRPAHKGDKLMAAIMHGRGQDGKIPHAWRALRGWRKLSPGRSRKAMPLGVWTALACELVRRGHLRMALSVVVGVSSYARPSELIRWRVFCLVTQKPGVSDQRCLLLSLEERPERLKTGEFDDSLALDSVYLKPWASRLFRQLKKGHPEQPLWDFDYSHFCKMFYQAAQALKLSVTPYQWRHSGPSIDRAKDRRSLLEVQKRGRWKSFKSVARYEKSARLGANFAQLGTSLQRHCQDTESLLEDVMLGRRLAPPPPIGGGA